MDDRHRGGGPRLRERRRSPADRLISALIRAESLQRAGLVRAAFTTRHGGVSRGAYRTFNLAYGVGDASEAVSTNRRRLADLLGMAPGSLVEAEQVHGNGVAVLARRDGTRPAPGGDPVRSVDALATDDPDRWLAIYAADCVPVLIVDPQTPAVAAAHAGWRGTAGGVVPATIARMREAFGTDPGHCSVELGPAIGGCCYEVDAPVARAMEGAPWWRAAARQTGPERWHLDLREALRLQLLALGVPADRICIAPYCTACRPDLFFSYRRDRVTGRMAACIRLHPPARIRSRPVE